jgi:hypothetical protein
MARHPPQPDGGWGVTQRVRLRWCAGNVGDSHRTPGQGEEDAEQATQVERGQTAVANE